MSAPVDVLAVLDSCVAVAKDNAAANAGAGPQQHVGECERARAAVAELIASDREYDEASAEWDLRCSVENGRRLDNAAARRRAALARCGGA